MTHCPLDEIPVPCEEPLWSLMARVGAPVPHWDDCTGRVGVNPLDNLRNEVVLQTLDARISALYNKPKKCRSNSPTPSDPRCPDNQRRLYGVASSAVPRNIVRSNISTPSFQGVSSVSFARSGLMTQTTRVGGTMIVGGSSSAAWAGSRVGQPGFMY